MLRSLDRDRLVSSLANSVRVAALVVPLSLLLGLAGAVLLTRRRSRVNGLLW